MLSTQPSWAWGLPEQYAEVTCILPEHDADGTAQEKDGRTPFDLASSDRGVAEVAYVLS